MSVGSWLRPEMFVIIKALGSAARGGGGRRQTFRTSSYL